MKSFKLQPLRISSGWKVVYNTFSEYEPDKDSEDYSYELSEDLLQLENQNLCLDLGWYPEGDINGSYKLCLVDTNVDLPFETPLVCFNSKSKKEIISMIECWTDYDFVSKYLR